MDPTAPCRGPGTWKLNTSLLNDDDYCRRVGLFWQDFRSEKRQFPGLLEWWECGKALLKDMTVTFDAQLAARKRMRKRNLERRVLRLTNEFREVSSCARAELEAAKYQLRQIISDVTRGYLLRARVAFLDAGETSRQFASAIQTSRGKASSLVAVKCQDDDSIANTTSCILHQVSSFYESLLMEEATNPDEVSVFLSSVTTKLASPDVEYLDSVVTLDEYSEALRSLQPGKSPGSDGLPAEFYKRFWDVLGSDLAEVLEECFSTSLLPFSMRTGHIRLLHKQGDRTNLRNWRPITLLNTDYKILAKVLARRLSVVVDTVVGSDPTCSIPGRCISDNIALARDIIDYCEQTQRPGAILNFDQEKAFDRVNCDYLHSVLRSFGFVEKFRRWI